MSIFINKQLLIEFLVKMDSYSNQPDVFDCITFGAILIGTLCDILIIDTIIHKQTLRKGMRLMVLSWAISDLFYLFNTSGFLHFLLKSLGIHIAPEHKLYIFQPHLIDEHASGLILQINCLIVIWLLAILSSNVDQTTLQTSIRWLMIAAFIVADLLIVFLKYDVSSNQVGNLRKAYVSLLILLIFVNEFFYLQLMCEDSNMDIDEVEMKHLKINIVRVYVYNWCFVYFMKCLASYGFHEAIASHAATKYFYAATICITLTAYLTGLYVLIHLLCNDKDFRKGFICFCTPMRRGNSINTDPDELSAIIMGTRYHHLYHTTEVM